MKNKIKNSRVLVTGGAGFIGSNLIEDLLIYENEVVCLDNLVTGKKDNIVGFLSNKNFSFIEGDIRDIKICQKACDCIDYVLHQAAIGSVPRSIKDPYFTSDVNIMGFINMLIAARDSNVKRFIYAASSSTYGDSKELPKIEDNIGNPLSPYAITKYVNELYAKNFYELYGLDSIGLRYFNVFGKRQDPHGAYAAVIPSFVSSLIKYKNPVINGDGSYSRDFTYIDNVILINHLSCLVKNPESLNTVYNVAHGEKTNLNQLFIILRDSLAEYDKKISTLDVIHGAFRDGDIPHSLASIDKAKKLLNYNPRYTFDEGIKLTAKWYYQNYK